MSPNVLETIIIDSALFLTEKCVWIIAGLIQVFPCDWAFLCLMDIPLVHFTSAYHSSIDHLAHSVLFWFFTQMTI